MKFKNNKEKLIYYWEKAKMYKEAGEEEAYIACLIKVKELRTKIEQEKIEDI